MEEPEHKHLKKTMMLVPSLKQKSSTCKMALEKASYQFSKLEIKPDSLDRESFSDLIIHQPVRLLK